MNYIINILEKIRKSYGVYIGTKSLEKLAEFLNGYECGIQDATNIQTCFNATFQRYIELEYDVLNNTTLHWSKIITTNRSDEEAFDVFFVYFDKFKRNIS